jgi:hypothetical protein
VARVEHQNGNEGLIFIPHPFAEVSVGMFIVEDGFTFDGVFFC